MTVADDEKILTNALEIASRTFREMHPNATLLGSDPDDTVLNPLKAAIDACETYRAVAGHVVFSGGSGPVIHSSSLAAQLFSRGARYGDNFAEAVAWLLRILTTRKATMLFKSAVWGLSVDSEIILSGTSHLIPFQDLPESYMKSRIIDRAKTCYDGSAWISQTYYDLPQAAFVETIDDFPYIGTDGACFRLMNELEQKAQELWILLQASSVGHPLAIACWFEYKDRELEYAEWENSFTWLLPEVHPYVKVNTPADADTIRANIANYEASPIKRRSALLRSMDRFRLSQCRRQSMDRILDLALGFEIAVSDEGDTAPPSWKVSVRSAQLIGGSLQQRQYNRTLLSALYELRNKATHGSELKTKQLKKPLDEILQDSYDLYTALVGRLLALRRRPNWKSIELEPNGATLMDHDDIDEGKKYKCDYQGGQYFATVIKKDKNQICVTLGDKINEDGDPGDPTEALGTLGELWVSAGDLHPM